jgi:phage terminase small subunit
MPPIEKAQWELFAQALFSGKGITAAAIEAGYSARNAASIGSRLSRKVNIKTRVQELQDAAASAKVMTVQERKERLSEIARARYSDFVTAGPDGTWIDVGPEKANSAAIKRVTSRTEYDKNGDHPSVVIGIELHPPVDAIKELNKMDGAYAPARTEVTGKGGRPLLQDLGNMTDDELEQIARKGKE